jgi:hypothetical protein
MFFAATEQVFPIYYKYYQCMMDHKICLSILKYVTIFSVYFLKSTSDLVLH